MIAPALATEPAVAQRDPTVDELRGMALGALPRMYRPSEHLYAFRLRRQDGLDVLEGVSRRYTAVALIGLSTETASDAREALQGHDPQDVCSRLVHSAGDAEDMGQVALSLWAARAWRSPEAGEALAALKRMDPARRACTTVELSWCLTALSTDDGWLGEKRLAEALARRLLGSFCPDSLLFSHWPADATPRSFRRHVACFADVVYPIQALSRYSLAGGHAEAIAAARACARRMCESQGPAGQWWWHHDIRTGAVIERYPVYSVHQDGMAPMAIRALGEACGDDYSEAAGKGLAWLLHAPEIDGSLIDRQAGLIWRKVARKEPGKLSRALQASASRLHPRLRLPLGMLLPPGRIDFETRPYHMGWILHAFRQEVR